MWHTWRYARDHRLLCIIIPSMIVSVHVMVFNRPRIIREGGTNGTEPKHRHFEDLQSFTYSVACSKLFEGDPDEHKRARTLLASPKTSRVIADKHYRISHHQCHAYRSERFNESFHREDTLINRQFPLAYSILMHDNLEQFERLLRLIYRPQNFYCIHIDSDASMDVQQGARSITQCFDNVFFPTKQENVFYGTFSRVQADLNCMQDLIRYPSWKYLLNMANSELPLKSNSELVKILSIYRGYNDIEGNWKSRNTERTKYVWKFINNTNGTHAARLRMTKQNKSPPPGNVDIVKGSAYGAFSRAFIEFVQTNSLAKELMDWSKDTYSPDEHYWSTLNYNTHLHTPGGYKAQSDPTRWTARFVNWGEQHCYGQVQRGICVFGIGDLPTLLNRYELFANKFQLKTDPIAFQCQEQLILTRSRGDLPLNNATFYRHMPFLVQP